MNDKSTTAGGILMGDLEAASGLRMVRALEQAGRAGKTDGQLFRPEEGDLEPGSVLRMVSADGSAAPFSDFTVLAAYWTDSSGNKIWDDEKFADRRRGREVLMARPYLYATHAGTSCPSWLTGVEEVKVDVKRVLGEDSMFRTVCTARGSLHGYVK